MISIHTKTAIQATLHCLTGCAIGEITGMVVGTGLGWHNAGTTILSLVLAFLFGYSLTFIPIYRRGIALKQALKLTIVADTASIATMEVVDNLIMLVVPGAMSAGLANSVFWASLMLSLFVAFWITVPVNRWLVIRGRGHAAVHAHHHHE